MLQMRTRRCPKHMDIEKSQCLAFRGVEPSHFPQNTCGTARSAPTTRSMKKTLGSTRHRYRGSMLLETLVSAMILTFASMAFGSGMIAATKGQDTAAVHARSTEIANYLL